MSEREEAGSIRRLGGLAARPGPPYVTFQQGEDERGKFYSLWVAAPPTLDIEAMNAAMNTPEADADILARGMHRVLVEYLGYHVTHAEDALMDRYRAGDTGADFWAEVDAAGLRYRPPREHIGPDARGACVVPYYTFPPLDALRLGLSDHLGRYWSKRPGEGIVHNRDKADFRVSYVDPGRSLAEHLQALACYGGLETAMLAGVLTLHALQHDGEARAIDDGLAEIGWDRRRGQSRDDARRWFAQAALFMNGCNVTGSGWGKFKGVDCSSRGPLFTTTILDPEQAPLAGIGETVPLAFKVRAEDFLQAVRNEPAALHYCGTLAALAGIPRGKPGGYWAAAIGMALLQRWRELAPQSKTTRGHVGEENRLTLRMQPITRRYLLTTYLPGPREEGEEAERHEGEEDAEDRRPPSVFDVLASNDPGRAKRYWAQALAYLRQAGILASDDPKVYGTGKPLPRYGWGEVWLDEPLNLRPSAELAEALAGINREAGAVRRAEARRRNRTRKDRPQ